MQTNGIASSLLVAIAVGVSSCGSGEPDTRAQASDNAAGDQHPSGDANIGPSGGAPIVTLPDATFDDVVYTSDGAPITSVTIEAPADTVDVTVTGEGAAATVQATSIQFTAKAQDGSAVNVGWSVDRGEIGTIDATTGLFTPSGKVAGQVTIKAGFGSNVATRVITVRIQRTQNGSTVPIDLTGSGGYGGVGGEGPGGALTAQQLTVLSGAATADASRKIVYPYGGTVFPRGLLAPLLQWTGGDADGVRIHLETKSQVYQYDGYFSRPAALAAGALFERHPIVQEIWEQATSSAGGGDTLAVSLTFLSGGKAVGPVSQTWFVAPARLSGTVYYNAYNTLLVKNEGNMGAAVLAIKPGSPNPAVVAGITTPAGAPNGTGCRACHTVSAKGNRLLVSDDVFQYHVTSMYDLGAAPPTETPLSIQDTFSWAALSPDGTLALTNGSYMGAATQHTTLLYRFDANEVATPVVTTGFKGALNTPVFSADGLHIAGTLLSGASVGTVPADGRHLLVMDFDPAGAAFSNPVSAFVLDAAEDARIGFASFLPTATALVLQKQFGSAGFGAYIGTAGTQSVPILKSEVWWTDVATAKQARLDALNGRNADGSSYLPTGPDNHDDDASLNYEPTVAPVASGGYAWVIFTSRRLYGNVATVDPSMSDPRTYDPTQIITTKKLWLAAVDLAAQAGTDPSHPAFYLPAQELHASNSRGYWVLDPCRADGTGCETGDQCCGGFCQPDAGGKLLCSNRTNTCAQYNEKCETAADCCDPKAQCIGGFCSAIAPPTEYIPR